MTGFTLKTWTVDNDRTAISGYRFQASYKCDTCGVSTLPQARPDQASADRAALTLTASHRCLRVG